MTSPINRTNLLKLVVISQLTLFSIAILRLSLSTSEYHLSLYNHAGELSFLVGWILLVITAISGGILIRDRVWGYVGIFGLLLLWLLVIAAPFLLGYQVEYGDEMRHVGETLDMIASGSLFPPGRFTAAIYPAFHVTAAEVAIITGIPANVLIGLSPLTLGLAYLPLLISIGRLYGIPARYVLVFFPLTLHQTLRSGAPSTVAYLTIFMLLLFMGTQNHISRRMSNVIIILGGSILWVFHPFNALFFLGCYTIFILFTEVPQTNKIPKLMSLFLTGYIWIMYSSRRVINKIEVILATILGASIRAQYPSGGGAIGSIQELGLSYVDIAWIASKRYFAWWVLLGLSFIAIVWYLRSESNRQLFPIIVFTAALFWAVVELAVGVFPAITPFRILRPAILISPIFAAYLAYQLVGQDNPLRTIPISRSTVSVALAVVLVISTAFAIGSTYRAPWTVDGNTYSTASEIQTWDWYYGHTEGEKDSVTLERKQTWYAEYVLKPEEETGQVDAMFASGRAPPHFGPNKYFGSVQNESFYYISDKRSRLMNLKVGDTSDFTREEFDGVRYEDPTVNVIYSVGNSSISVVYR